MLRKDGSIKTKNPQSLYYKVNKQYPKEMNQKVTTGIYVIQRYTVHNNQKKQMKG